MRRLPTKTFHVLIVAAAIATMAGFPVFAADEPDSSQDSASSLAQLAEMSLEDLSNAVISSVSKREEKQQAAAAAVYVITAEDIRRSTATSIPDLLRAVPGLHVAHLDANKWSVSSRGLSGRYANSLLVLIDGRSVYTPLFSGISWETRDVMLEDILRIEIIRGPGGPLWGANAVNGVINIVTKGAEDTQGGLVSAGAGTEEEGFGAVRYGGTVGDVGSYRVYAKYFQRDDGVFDSGRRANDGWQSTQGGARFDWNWEDTHLTLQGDIYGTDADQTYETAALRFPRTREQEVGSYFSGGNLLARWTREFVGGGELSVQTYYDRSDSNILTISEERDTLDVDVQYRMAPRGRHEFLWGTGFRYFDDRTETKDLFAVTPAEQRKRLFSAFIQDRIDLIDEKLKLTLGTKLEYNDFTGVEIQPSIRLAWTPNDNHTVWAAISRAVRTPSLIESGGRLASQAFPGILISLFGNEDFDSEELLAYELGYRVQPSDNLLLDLALFYNQYDGLRTVEFGLPVLEFSPRPLHLLVPARPQNNMEGHTYGLELNVDWKPQPWWRVHMNYSLLQMNLDINAKTLDIVSQGINESSPEHQVFLNNSFSLSRNTELDLTLRYVGALSGLGVEDYVTMDVRLGWQPSDDFEIALIGRNLLDAEHEEFASMFVDTLPTQVQRGVYGKLTWRF